MASSDPSLRPGRLAAVLGPPLPERRRSHVASSGLGAAVEPPTVPVALPAVSGEPAFDAPLSEGWSARSDALQPDTEHGVVESATTGRADGFGPDEAASGTHRGRSGRRWLPAAWRGARLDPGRPGATALALVAAAAAVVAAVGVWSERPRAEPVGGLPVVAAAAESSDAPTGTAAPGPDRATAGAATAPAPQEPAAPLIVSVSGKVRRPGLVEVPAGSRVADVLDAAGGALPGTDLAPLNLARRVSDGEQVAVGVPAAAAVDAGPAAGSPPGASGAGAAPTPAGKLDLNAATAEQLDGLPGVGPVTAQRILEWRARNGRFARVEQLREVEGIGERRFGQLRELVTV